MFKLPLNPKRKKILFVGACCITSLAKQKKFPQNVCHFFSIINNTSIFDQPQVNHHFLYNFNLELVIYLKSNQSTLKTLGKLRKNSMVYFHTTMHATWYSNLQVCILAFEAYLATWVFSNVYHKNMEYDSGAATFNNKQEASL